LIGKFSLPLSFLKNEHFIQNSMNLSEYMTPGLENTHLLKVMQTAVNVHSIHVAKDSPKSKMVGGLDELSS
jgi:hypothetical protein